MNAIGDGGGGGGGVNDEINNESKRNEAKIMRKAQKMY